MPRSDLEMVEMIDVEFGEVTELALYGEGVQMLYLFGADIASFTEAQVFASRNLSDCCF